ncbi:MAG: hypothetical protein JWO82_815, partial [Akkermansiaceae bacterium]|nr:hypothetical protein [Akkermansiaceae bacterium]
DLSAVNLTLLGTPPPSSPGNSVGTSPVYATAADLTLVAINLSSGSSGNGWTRITLGL